MSARRILQLGKPVLNKAFLSNDQMKDELLLCCSLLSSLSQLLQIYAQETEMNGEGNVGLKIQFHKIHSHFF